MRQKKPRRYIKNMRCFKKEIPAECISTLPVEEISTDEKKSSEPSELLLYVG